MLCYALWCAHFHWADLQYKYIANEAHIHVLVIQESISSILNQEINMWTENRNSFPISATSI